MWVGGAPTVLHLHDHELGNLGKAAVVNVCKVHEDAFTSCGSLADGFGALQREGLREIKSDVWLQHTAAHCST